MAFLRSDDGQAAIDYVALIAVLAVLLGAAAATAGGGAASMTNAVLGQLRRALCVVTGGACPAERQLPCVVAADRDSVHFGVAFAILRVDKDVVLLRERLSDGTVRMTRSTRTGTGLAGGLGARARLRLKGRTIGSEREMHGGVEGVFGHSEVYVARDDREADKLLHRLLRPHLPLIGGPHPREIFVEGGVRALGRLGLSSADVGASLDGIAEGIVGARRDMRSGGVTISLGASGSGWALASALMAGSTGGSDGSAGLALTLDRHHRPTELSLSASGTFAAGTSLLPAVVRMSGAAGAGDSDTGGRRWELGARIDLRDPEVAAAWDAFRHDASDPAAIRALVARIRERAHLDVRSYAQRSESDGVAAGIALALKAGGEVDYTRDRSRLLTAATRPPGGLWEQRIDCVGA